jgi:transcriptional regulator with XRE-family HTH domain
MLKLRKRLGLTQAGLADLVGVSRHAVGEWEAGLNYPRAEHLQYVLGLCVQHHVFVAGQEEEEIRALWKTAQQRVLLDEAWLAAFLPGDERPTRSVRRYLRFLFIGSGDRSLWLWR